MSKIAIAKDSFSMSEISLVYRWGR